VPETPPGLIQVLQRLAPGTSLRQALERIIQQGSGALVSLGLNQAVQSVTSGGFRLQGATFTPARLAELAKMDGGIILDDDWERILAANVHFLPPANLPTDETGARHRTAQRLAAHARRPVVAVSRGRNVATLFYEDAKIELASPTILVARVTQDLQTLERLRRSLDESEERLTLLEATGLVTYRAAVTVLQRAELVLRMGHLIERDAVTLGEEGRLVWIQLADLRRGVENLREATLDDYIKPRRPRVSAEALEALEGLAMAELDDPAKVGKAVTFPELDETASPRGARLLLRAGRIPENVQDELLRHFRTLDRLLSASTEELEEVEGIGPSRATHLRRFFDRIEVAASSWEPDLG
jgi:diadenylate cyclase